MPSATALCTYLRGKENHQGLGAVGAVAGAALLEQWNRNQQGASLTCCSC